MCKAASVCKKLGEEGSNVLVAVVLAESHLFRVCLLWLLASTEEDKPGAGAGCEKAHSALPPPLVNRLYLVLFLKEAFSSPVAEGSACSLGSSYSFFFKKDSGK